MCDPVQALGERREAVVSFEPRGRQGRVTIVGEGAAHGPAVSTPALGFGVCPLFQLPVNGAHAADALCECLLGLAIGLVDKLGRFAHGVEVPERVWHIRAGGCDGTADGGLSVGEDPDDGPPERRLYFTKQVGQVGLGGRPQAAGEEYLRGETIAPAPEHLGANVRLQPIER